MHDLLQLGASGLIDLLSPELASKLQKLGKIIQYRDGQLIHSRGDEKPGISIVHSGAVRVGIVGRDGSFLTTSVFGPGQCFGEFTLFAGLPRTHDVTAEGDCSIHQIPGTQFQALFDSEPELAKALLALTLIRAHNLLEFLDDLRRLPLPVHLAKFLLKMTEAVDGSVQLHCRQEDLAYAFGVSRVSIGKVLKRLEHEALLELGYGRITLPDVAQLRSWVEARNVVLPLTSSLDNLSSKQ